MVTGFGSVKLGSEITAQEWVLYEWIDITTVSDPERCFVRGLAKWPQHPHYEICQYCGMRNPADALQCWACGGNPLAEL